LPVSRKTIFIFCLQAKKVDLFKMISTLRKWHNRKSLKDLLHCIKKKAIEPISKRPILSPANGGTEGSNFNPRNTQCIPVVNPPEADRLP